LKAALERNLLRGDAVAEDGLVDFVIALDQQVQAIGAKNILSGQLA